MVTRRQPNTLGWIVVSLVFFLLGMGGIMLGMADRDFFHTETLGYYAFMWMLVCFGAGFFILLIGAVKAVMEVWES